MPMSDRSQITLYNLHFVFWVLVFIVVLFFANGMSTFGKTRALSGFTSAAFVCVVAFYFWRISGDERIRRVVYISTGAWVALIVTLFAPLFLALFFEPPYEHLESLLREGGMNESNIFKLVNGPAVSAGTEYVRWVFGWGVYRDAVLFGY